MKRLFDKISKFWKKSVKQNAIQIRNEYIYWELKWRQSIRAALCKLFFSPDVPDPDPTTYHLVCTNSHDAKLFVLEDGKTFIEVES